MNKLGLTAVLRVMGAFTIMGSAGAAQAGTESATGTATIATPIALSKTQDLDYGKVVVGPGANPWVAMDVWTGNRFCANDTVCLGSATAARFNVSGSMNANISFPRTIPFTGPAGPAMYIDMTCQAHNPGGPLIVPEGDVISLTTAGTQVGCAGTLHANPGQPNGNYNGSFTLTVDYP